VIERDRFAGCIGSRFRVADAPQPDFELKLDAVEERKAPPDWEVFSLIFQGPAAPRLEQRIYSLQHSELGELGLFLVPIGALPNGICYEALFNRRRQKEPSGA